MKTQKTKGCRKAGRNKKPKDQATSLYSRGKISFEKYRKMKGLR